ncbi:heterokaryon incompatibility protein-domain-containing protein [Hypoxylon sp. FL1284]|nr:heterokaryon incompatibility protein-domain-containing protein [Hypoxylon sp. FL1284]
MVRYRHAPLPGNKCIRLATIHPGSFNDDVVVSFQTVAFPGPEYEALSYVWGLKEDPLPVYVSRCDDGATSVLQETRNLRLEVMLMTQSLVVALRHLRYVEKPRTMWIDALCIHQTDAAEKGPQVAMMGDIFRHAHKVIAWLGPEQNESSLAMDWMSYLASQIEVDHTAVFISAADGCSDPSIADTHVELPLDPRDLRSVYHLICRPWFERLWVRQEIQLANSDAVIVCGFQQLPMPKTLGSALRYSLSTSRT